MPLQEQAEDFVERCPMDERAQDDNLADDANRSGRQNEDDYSQLIMTLGRRAAHTITWRVFPTTGCMIPPPLWLLRGWTYKVMS